MRSPDPSRKALAGVCHPSAQPLHISQPGLSQQRVRVLVHKICLQIRLEQAGVAMYEALIARCAEQDPPAAVADLSLLSSFREDRIRHLHLLQAVVERIRTESNDPEFTPCPALTQAGSVRAIREDRSSITRSLQVLLAADLIDADCWSWLQTAAQQSGYVDAAQAFGLAGADQARHRQQLRAWYVQWTEAAPEVPARDRGPVNFSWI